MSLQIRFAQASDLPFILEILNHEITFGTAVYDYDQKTIAEIEQWYNEKQQHDFPLLVAMQDEKLMGYATYGFFRPRPGYRFTLEHSVYLNEQAQGKGIGKQLMHQLIELAKAAGFRSMIGVVDASNAGSCAFHHKLGFLEAGRLKEAGYKFDTWLDVVFYQLNLTK